MTLYCKRLLCLVMDYFCTIFPIVYTPGNIKYIYSSHIHSLLELIVFIQVEYCSRRSNWVCNTSVVDVLHCKESSSCENIYAYSINLKSSVQLHIIDYHSQHAHTSSMFLPNKQKFAGMIKNVVSIKMRMTESLSLLYQNMLY